MPHILTIGSYLLASKVHKGTAAICCFLAKHVILAAVDIGRALFEGKANRRDCLVEICVGIAESPKFNRRDRTASSEEGLLDREETSAEERERESEGQRVTGADTAMQVG